MKTLQTDEAPKAIGPYSQGQLVNGFLFCSGQIPLDPKTGEIVGENIQEQTKQVLNNIAALLKASNLTSNDVIKTTCFLKDMNDFQAFNEVYAEFFQDHKPARSAIGIAALPKGALVEIEIIAKAN